MSQQNQQYLFEASQEVFERFHNQKSLDTALHILNAADQNEDDFLGAQAVLMVNGLL